MNGVDRDGSIEVNTHRGDIAAVLTSLDVAAAWPGVSKILLQELAAKDESVSVKLGRRRRAVSVTAPPTPRPSGLATASRRNDNEQSNVT